jgi:hypothetical protein
MQHRTVAEQRAKVRMLLAEAAGDMQQYGAFTADAPAAEDPSHRSAPLPTLPPIATIKEQLVDTCKEQPEVLEWWHAHQWDRVAGAMLLHEPGSATDRYHLADNLRQHRESFERVLRQAGLLSADTVENARQLLQQGLSLLSIQPICREWQQWHPARIAASLGRYARPGLDLALLARTIADNKTYLEECFPVLTGWLKCCAYSASVRGNNRGTTASNMLPGMPTQKLHQWSSTTAVALERVGAGLIRKATAWQRQVHHHRQPAACR